MMGFFVFVGKKSLLFLTSGYMLGGKNRGMSHV